MAELELHLKASRDPDLQEASRRCFAAYESVAAAALEALRVPEPARHAPVIVALLTGLSVMRLGGGRPDAAGLADALRTLVRGAVAEGRSGRGSALRQWFFGLAVSRLARSHKASLVCAVAMALIAVLAANTASALQIRAGDLLITAEGGFPQPPFPSTKMPPSRSMAAAASRPSPATFLPS